MGLPPNFRYQTHLLSASNDQGSRPRREGPRGRQQARVLFDAGMGQVGYSQTYQQRFDDTARILMDLERTYASRRNDQHRIILWYVGLDSWPVQLAFALQAQ